MFKKIITVLITLLLPASTLAASVFLPVQGGTGIGSATAGDVGDCLKVLDDSPFTFELGTCSAGSFSYLFTNTSYGGSTTTILGFLQGLFSTASSTFNGPLFITNLSQGLLYNGTNGLTQSVATSSATCSGNIACSAFTVVGAVSPNFTFTGTLPIANGGTNATSFPLNSLIGYDGSTLIATGTPKLTIGYLRATSTSVASVLPYASTTALSVSSSFAVTPLTSALTLTGADGTFAEYAGASCTNQFVRSLSALGASTCATVVAGDVDLADLTATNASLTFTGAYDGSTARTVGLNMANANTWTALQTFGAASSTYFSVATYLGIPSTTPTTNGELALETTQASTSLRFHDGSAERALYPEIERSFEVGSSTLRDFANGTSTIRAANYLRGMTLLNWYCKTNGTGGTINIRWGDGTASSTMTQCNATGVSTTLSSNNTYTMREDLMVEASSTSATFDKVTVTYTVRPNAE